jgi:hypothetical protein
MSLRMSSGLPGGSPLILHAIERIVEIKRDINLPISKIEHTTRLSRNLISGRTKRKAFSSTPRKWKHLRMVILPGKWTV